MTPRAHVRSVAVPVVGHLAEVPPFKVFGADKKGGKPAIAPLDAGFIARPVIGTDLQQGPVTMAEAYGISLRKRGPTATEDGGWADVEQCQ